MKTNIVPRPWLLAAALAGLLAPCPLLAAPVTLADFSAADSLAPWISVNDGVMGGVSTGGFKRTAEGTLLFTGELSLANNGGFASIRTRPSATGFPGVSAIVVRARGDGRTYWVEVRTAGQMAAGSYRAWLPTTAGEWRETSIPIADFKPQAFGRDLPFKAVNPADIASIGFTLADKKEGPFSLEIAWVKAAGTQPAAAGPAGNLVEVATAAGGFKTLLAALTAADLAGVLAGPGPFTVLAPTDEAFAKLPAGTLDSLLKPENRPRLAALLKNHVIPGRVTLAGALEARGAVTLQGGTLPVRFRDGRVRVGAATLLSADIQAANGVIHVIDQVLPVSSASGSLSPAPARLVELAVERGVPLFNRGEVDACAAIYEITCEALQLAPGVAEKTRGEIAVSLSAARAEPSPREQAWILRRALDRALPDL